MASNSLIGRTLGKYLIQKLIGQGGMATVYLGYQSDIDRSVAIKVLPPHPGQDPQFADRFQYEARTIARLQHPHILSIFDFGIEDNILYLVMPYVQGGSLREIMREPIPAEQVDKLLLPIASALDYAHRQGVIHRDIKPDNILLDESGHPILSDFGIAKLVESNAQFTASGGFLGTPAYMAPEQGRGMANIDGRADIYALGVVVYEMLTGRHPYTAETPMMVMFKHVSDPVPSLLTVDPKASPIVDKALRKALAKEPDSRFSTAMAFSQAFTAALSGTAISDTAEVPRNFVNEVIKKVQERHAESPTVIGSTTTNPKNEPGVITKSARAVEDHTLLPESQTIRTTSSSPASQPPQNSSLYIGGALLLAAILALVAFFALSGGEDNDQTNEIADVPSATASITPTDTETAQPT